MIFPSWASRPFTKNTIPFLANANLFGSQNFTPYNRTVSMPTHKIHRLRSASVCNSFYFPFYLPRALSKTSANKVPTFFLPYLIFSIKFDTQSLNMLLVSTTTNAKPFRISSILGKKKRKKEKKKKKKPNLFDCRIWLHVMVSHQT